MNVQGKVWGETTCIFATDTVSAHFLRIKEGGHCSEHQHRHKSNLFYIIRGKLKVTIWTGGGEDRTILTDGQLTAVPPGLWHKFEALEDTECIEIYRVFLQEPDIDRRTQGGMRK